MINMICRFIVIHCWIVIMMLPVAADCLLLLKQCHVAEWNFKLTTKQ